MDIYDLILKDNKLPLDPDKQETIFKLLKTKAKITLSSLDEMDQDSSSSQESSSSQDTSSSQEYSSSSSQNIKSKLFYTNVCDNPDNIKLFIVFLWIFYNISKNMKNMYVGIDYEFNERKIALCQLCFFIDNDNYVWIIDPREFDDIQIKLFIKYLYRNKNIYKILHGADSLDIPYMFNELFKNDLTTIMKFIRKLIDTRFLCEYSKINSKQLLKKCSIYDALLYFKVITEEKYNWLQTNNEQMDPIYKLQWDIKHLKSFQLQYAVYDVIFLNTFLVNMLKQSHESIKIIPELTRFVFLDKYEIIDIVKNLKQIVDPMNIYRIHNKKSNLVKDTLITTFQQLIPTYIINIGFDIEFNNLFQVNYFKAPLSIILKYILYSVLNKKYKITIKNNIFYSKDLSTNLIYDLLTKLEMKQLYNLFKKFELDLLSKL